MLAQYFPINYKDDDGGPAPMALGTNGLAEAARITRDGVPHMSAGSRARQCGVLAAPTPADCSASSMGRKPLGAGNIDSPARRC